MIPIQRRIMIKRLLQEQEILLLEDIVRQLNISESTARRDLKALSQDGDIELLRGGGARMRAPNAVRPMPVRQEAPSEDIMLLANYASKRIHPGDVVFLDASPVNLLVIDFLQTQSIKIMTNSIAHVNKLLALGMDCTFIGGEILSTTGSALGPMAERFIRDLRFSKCFLTPDGFSIKMGITDHDSDVQSLHRLIVDRSAVCFFLLQASAYGMVATHKVADLDECEIILDTTVDELASFRNVHVATMPQTAEPTNP